MTPDPALLLPATAAAALLGAGLTFALARLATRHGFVDAPGGRKTHATSVPLVGGIAIFIASSAVLLALLEMEAAMPFVAALALLVSVGALDDAADLRPRYKFGAQVLAAAVMVYIGGVELATVGDLLGWKVLWLSFLSIPLTVFAAVGVVNSINMVDGLDGLAGGVSFFAFAWYALIGWESGLLHQSGLAVVLAGAVAGFLAFNVRFPWQPQAKAFLGDAGSLMIGFALAWLAVDLTQGPKRSFPAIAALWVIVLPLADCVSLMTRRVFAGRSPFVADREHIHHYLLERGFTVNQTVAILVLLSAAFGAVGYAGWKLRLPEWALFWPFFFGYFAYHAWIQRAWRKLRP